MSKFDTIDSKLKLLADKLNARITKDRPGYPESLRTFEERRIDWTDNSVDKAIIIQPTFEANGVDSSRWNLINVAWFDDSKTGKRFRWHSKLAEKIPFQKIEESIDSLLEKSANNLNRVTQDDLV